MYILYNFIQKSVVTEYLKKLKGENEAIGLTQLSNHSDSTYSISGSDEYIAVTTSFRKSLASVACNLNRECVLPENSFKKLIEKLIEKDLRYVVHTGEEGEVIGLSYHDPELSPSTEESIHVLEGDVTHSVFESKCGFEKLSIWTSVTINMYNL